MKLALRNENTVFLASCLLGLWLALTMPVFAQEAYYWSYAQYPDLSYYDHPPMVAWLIWLGTHAFGDGPLGLRLGTWLCSCLTTWIGLTWLRELGGDARARLGFIVCSLGVPLCAASHFLTNPDPPLSLFWMLSVFALWRARQGHLGCWVLAGLAAGCALLSKYTAGFLAVGGLIVLLCDPQMRAQWRRPGPYVAVVAAAVTFLPVIAWNVNNDFESFRFQTGRFQKAEIGLHWLVQFAAGQFLVFHPVLLLVLPVAVVKLWRQARQRDQRATWLLAFGLPLPLFFSASAVFIQVKINWLLPAYGPLLCGILLWWRGHEEWLTRDQPRLCRTAIWAVAATAMALPALAPLIHFVPQRGGSSWVGWDQIAQRTTFWKEDLERRIGGDRHVFLCAPNYKDAAQLMRQIKLNASRSSSAKSEPMPTVMAQNVFGEPALQFDHWDAPSRHVGHDAVFVVSLPDRYHDLEHRLGVHFAAVKRVERVRIEWLGITLAEADVYQCRGYRGPHPGCNACRR